MMPIRPRIFAALLVVLAATPVASAQTPVQAGPPQTTGKPQTPGQTRLRVFLECDCFAEYMREEIEWVDFVRQPQDAQLRANREAFDEA